MDKKQTAPKKMIDFDTSLKARGLFALAQQHYQKAQEFERALGALLGELDNPASSYCGHFSDEMFDGDFDTAMRKSQIGVTPPKKNKRR